MTQRTAGPRTRTRVLALAIQVAVLAFLIQGASYWLHAQAAWVPYVPFWQVLLYVLAVLAVAGVAVLVWFGIRVGQTFRRRYAELAAQDAE